MYVLDTDVCIDLLRRPDDILPHVRPLQDRAPLATTAITVHELHEGAHRAEDTGKELRAVNRLLSALAILPHDAGSAEHAGRLAAMLLQRETPIGDFDTAIAGIALHHGATVVTRNTKHFQQVPDLTLHALPAADRV